MLTANTHTLTNEESLRLKDGFLFFAAKNAAEEAIPLSELTMVSAAAGSMIGEAALALYLRGDRMLILPAAHPRFRILLGELSYALPLDQTRLTGAYASANRTFVLWRAEKSEAR